MLSTTAGREQFRLTVWVPGACGPDAAQARQALRSHLRDGGPHLRCTSSSLPAGWQGRVARAAPAVNGRPAFWTVGHVLAWEYAPGAWATLAYGVSVTSGSASESVPAATMRKIAGHVRYNVTGAVRFPYRLTGLPARWPVTLATWVISPEFPGYLAGRTLVAGPVAYLAVGPEQGPLAMQGPLAVSPGSGNCSMQYGSERVTLNGAKAVVTLIPQKGVPPSQSLCVPGYHGLSVVLILQARAGGRFSLGGVTGIFLHHPHLLGTDPVHWTTRPLP